MQCEKDPIALTPEQLDRLDKYLNNLMASVDLPGFLPLIHRAARAYRDLMVSKKGA